MIRSKAYMSMVLDHDAASVWSKVADFAEYRWGEGVGEAQIDGVDANAPGAVRSFEYYGQASRQRLLEHDPESRTMRWESVEPFDATLAYYAATLRVTPVTATGRSFVEWWSDFDSVPEAAGPWSAHQRREFQKSLERLALCLTWDRRAAEAAMDKAVRATCASIIDRPVEQVWALIRDFNNYPAYIDGVTDSILENDLRGDEVGAVRRFLYGGHWIRQRLDAHSDEERMLAYAGLDPFEFPDGTVPETPSPARYAGTMRLLPIDNGARTVIDWTVTLDALPAEAAPWRDLLLTLIPDWIASLKRAVERGD